MSLNSLSPANKNLLQNRTTTPVPLYNPSVNSLNQKTQDSIILTDSTKPQIINVKSSKLPTILSCVAVATSLIAFASGKKNGQQDCSKLAENLKQLGEQIKRIYDKDQEISTTTINTITTLQTILNKHAEEISTNDKAIATVTNKLEELSSELKKFGIDLSKLDDSISAVKKEKADSQTVTQKLKEIADAFDKAIQEIKEKQKQDIIEVRTDLTSQGRTIEQLKGTDSQRKDIAKLRKTVALHSKKLDEHDKLIKSLDDILTQVRNDLSEHSKDIENALARIDSLEAKYEEMDKTLGDVFDVGSKFSKKLSRTRTELKRLQEAFSTSENKIADLEKTRIAQRDFEKLQKQVLDSKNTVAKLNSEFNDLQIKIDTLSTDLTELTEQTEGLQEKADAISGSKGDTGAIDKLKKRMSTAEKRIDRNEEEITALKNNPKAPVKEAPEGSEEISKGAENQATETPAQEKEKKGLFRRIKDGVSEFFKEEEDTDTVVSLEEYEKNRLKPASEIMPVVTNAASEVPATNTTSEKVLANATSETPTPASEVPVIKAPTSRRERRLAGTQQDITPENPVTTDKVKIGTDSAATTDKVDDSIPDKKPVSTLSKEQISQRNREECKNKYGFYFKDGLMYDKDGKLFEGTKKFKLESGALASITAEGGKIVKSQKEEKFKEGKKLFKKFYKREEVDNCGKKYNQTQVRCDQKEYDAENNLLIKSTNVLCSGKKASNPQEGYIKFYSCSPEDKHYTHCTETQKYEFSKVGVIRHTANADKTVDTTLISPNKSTLDIDTRTEDVKIVDRTDEDIKYSEIEVSSLAKNLFESLLRGRKLK